MYKDMVGHSKNINEVVCTNVETSFVKIDRFF